ncbi:NAD(P)-dependent oxidoreductase [Streptomyces albireticuli]|nr:NAD(P)-binding domain-containing protein [Streptomyces albireticuli]
MTNHLSAGIPADLSTEHDYAPVTVVGLGPMGVALAEAFLRTGHPTTVWNRSPEKADGLVARGARRAAGITEAVSASSVVVVCVKDYEALYGILEPAGDALAGRALVNLASGTPEQAHEAVAWAAARGAGYLDGAIMVPTAGVGRPGAVFLYSGSREVFDAHRPALAAMGGTTYLGADPSLAVLHNTALLGLMYATINGFLHAAALVGTAGVTATEFSRIAADWFLPDVVTGMLGAQAPALDEGRYPGEQATMEMNLTALDHIHRTSAERGVDTELPGLMKSLAERAVGAGFGADSYFALVELLKKPAPPR